MIWLLYISNEKRGARKCHVEARMRNRSMRAASRASNARPARHKREKYIQAKCSCGGNGAARPVVVGVAVIERPALILSCVSIPGPTKNIKRGHHFDGVALAFRGIMKYVVRSAGRGARNVTV